MHTNHYLHRRCAIALCAAALLGAVPLGAQVGLGLAPMRVELRLSPGARQSGSLLLSNGSGAKTRVRTELLDFYVDQTETPQFGRSWPQEKDYSCRDWLTINPMEAELAPGASVLVRYTVEVPVGTSERGYHCAAGFTTMSPAESLVETGLRTAVRIVGTFYVTTGNPRVDGRVTDIRLERQPDSENHAWRAVVVIGNEGATHFRPAGELAVLDTGGRLLESAPFRSLPVLPKREQRFLFPLKTPLPPGRYVLRARVDLGMDEIQEASATVSTDTQER